MEYILLNIEQKSSTEVLLFVKPNINTWTPMKILKVSNLHSPVILASNSGCVERLSNDLPCHIKRSPPSRMFNVFDPKFPFEVDCIRIYDNFEFIELFESDYCDFIITEFVSPVENFIISKKLKGVSLIEVDNDKNVYNSNDIIIKETHNTLPKLKIASITNELEYYSLSIATKAGSIAELNNIIKDEHPDILIYHNLKLKINLKNYIVCDIFGMAKNSLKGRDFSVEELTSFYKIDSTGAKAIYDLFHVMNLLNLGLELSEISGILLNQALRNSRLERIEYLLLHNLYSKNIIFPPKSSMIKHSYTGGLVLEPKRNFYTDYIMLLDFNSLYPSIIQEFDLCFSDKIKILPNILKNLVNRRKNVKSLITKDKDNVTLKARSNALKLTANSIYGCLGSNISRFANVYLASTITKKGRELLLEAKKIAEELGHEVIYGDTDSIMINSKSKDHDRCLEISKEIENNVNKRFKCLEIEMECIFKKMMLFTKKKYGGLTYQNQIETKGLDSIRRDFCILSSEIYNKVLSCLLLDEDTSKVYDILTEYKINFENEPINKFVISTQLNKELSMYNSNLPHIILAKRLSDKIKYEKDDIINYVMGEDGPYHPKESFKINYEYYIENQILPPIHRLTSLTTLSQEKINLIFGVKKIIRLNSEILKFTTECCSHTQSYNLKCLNCNNEIDIKFYMKTIYKMIKEEIERMYEYKGKCIECNKNTYKLTCCGSPVNFEIRNSNFDKLINSISVIKIKEIQDFIQMYSRKSDYRKIDMSKYFKINYKI